MPVVVAGFVDFLVGSLKIGVREVFLHQFVDPEAAVVGTVFPADPRNPSFVQPSLVSKGSFFPSPGRGQRASGVEVGPYASVAAVRHIEAKLKIFIGAELDHLVIGVFAVMGRCLDRNLVATCALTLDGGLSEKDGRNARILLPSCRSRG